MNKPEVWTFEELLRADLGNAAVWTLQFLRKRIGEKFARPIIGENEEPESGLDTLLVIGGGVLIDRAKVWRKENKPDMKLIAIPSIWGSGAENSPIAVIDEGGKKIIQMDLEYLPDVRVIWNALSETIPEERIKYACGDVWSHALEGFLSPIASGEVRNELTDVVKSLERLAIKNDPAWFEFSARACAGQAKSSAGLVHGIAHTLEGLMKQEYPEKYFGHAQLCGTYLWPVFSLNMELTNKIDNLFDQYGIDKAKVIDTLKKLFDENVYNLALPVLQDNWRSVLRDPSTRTNCALVRPSHLSHFTDRKFE